MKCPKKILLLSLGIGGLVALSCQRAAVKTTTTPPRPTPAPEEIFTVPEAKTAYAKGVEALKEKKGPVAIKEFGRCLSAQSNSVACHWELGWSHFINHDYEKAQTHWNFVLKNDPLRPKLSQALAKINFHTRLMEKARALRSLAPATFRPTNTRQTASQIFRLHAVGDIMIGTDFPVPHLPPENVSPFAKTSSYFQEAIINFGNYEGTLCDSGTSVKCGEAPTSETCYAFRTPKKYARYLKEAGFNLLSLANNHIMDFGEECRTESERTLDEWGIPWSGRAGTVARIRVQEKDFSLIAFHSSYHTNSTLDLESAKKLVVEEKNQHRIVIVSFHGGGEGYPAVHIPDGEEIYLGENRGDVKLFARTMVDSGADLVLGSGPHVLRGMEIYKNKLVAYSLGNFATYRTINILGFSGIGVILEVDLDEQGDFQAGRIIPLKQIGWGYPVPDSREIATDLMRFLSQADLPDHGVVMARDGTFTAKKGEKDGGKK